MAKALIADARKTKSYCDANEDVYYQNGFIDGIKTMDKLQQKPTPPRRRQLKNGA
jgi:hypothetical protein